MKIFSVELLNHKYGTFTIVCRSICSYQEDVYYSYRYIDDAEDTEERMELDEIIHRDDRNFR